VMPFLEGENLQQRLSRSKEKPLSLEEAAAILLGACSGVDHCHRAQIVHRDLKPANIFLTTDQGTGRLVVKVLDFGVAKPRVAEQGDLTGDGLVLGTPSYMPPEQARGLPVDARSDQYALGALLYTCLAMRKPYEHVEAGLSTREERGRAILRALRDEQGFPPPRTYRPDIPPSLEAAILRAMSADPDERFGSVFEFSREILPHASEDVRRDLRSYFDATPRPISQPQLSIALASSSGLSVDHPFARRESDLPTTKSLRRPHPPSTDPTNLSSAEPLPSTPPGPLDPGTAKMPSDIQALLRTATRPPSAPPEDSTSLAPSQVTTTIRDRRVPRGSLVLALAGTAALAIGLVVYLERADHEVAVRPSAAAVRPQPSLELLPAVHPHTPQPGSAAAPPPLPTVIPKPDLPAPPPASTTTPVTDGDDHGLTPAPLRVRRDRNGNRVTVDKRGRRWAVDGSGRRLYQVDVTGQTL
jgi:serine/threonine protein kinase